MRKIIMMSIWCLLPFVVSAQSEEKIQFSNAKNWQEVLLESRKANKPIFVDAYATWCVPCKMMEKEVFTSKGVAEFVNNNFISVRVQMDSTKNDDKFIKDWYNDARSWKAYVSAYPSFLFFTPEGKYSGKEQGYYQPNEFVMLLKKVIDPKGSYLAQNEAFKAGKLTRQQVMDLANWAKRNKDDSVANFVARFYKQRYMDDMSVDSLLNEKTDIFRSTFKDIFVFNDKLIKYMYKHPELADKKIGRWTGYSNAVVNYYINRDNIEGKLYQSGIPIASNPDWKEIEHTISRKFDKKTAQRVVLNAKIDWAYKQKQWTDAANLELQKIEKYGLDTTSIGRVQVNNLIYGVIFKYVEDITTLKKAVSLMQKVVELDRFESHIRLDTYAGILYKAGERIKAIKIEVDALKLASDANDKQNVKFYTDMIQKMKDGNAIWKEL